MEPRMEVHHEGTNMERIELQGRHAQWTFDALDKDGDVCIECCGSETNAVFLTQDELKTLIAFLQRQVK